MTAIAALAIHHTTEPIPSSAARRRARLADLLNRAAELEHGAMSLYLFAAFSLKKSVAEGDVTYRQMELVRRWHASLMMIARQEMEHLGIVCNLLTAIGEGPRLRPGVSSATARTDALLGQNYPLARFDRDQLVRFVTIEMPAELDGADRELLGTLIEDFDPSRFDGVFRLYSEIHSYFDRADAAELIIGPPSAQTSTHGIFPNSIRGLNLGDAPAYDVSLMTVESPADARRAVELVIEQGEGGVGGSADSHFARFMAILRDLLTELEADPSFAPARPVIVNPTIGTAPNVTDDGAVQLMRLFDDAFATTVLLLTRFFMHTDQNPAQAAALQRAVFFPMMTTVIRPLAELLTELPATPATTERAGPSFELPDLVPMLPHRDVAWRVLHGRLEALRDDADAARANPTFGAPARQRLDLMWENLHRVASDFGERMGVTA